MKHRVHVPLGWLEMGVTIDVELPRNVLCARCDGGGCDACGGAGAISLRGRKDPPEHLQVRLPPTGGGDDDGPPPASVAAGQRHIVLRIPDRGGLPDDGGQRGNLLLQVRSGDAADDKVRLVQEAPEDALAASGPSEPPVAGNGGGSLTAPELPVPMPVLVVALLLGLLVLMGLVRALGLF